MDNKISVMFICNSGAGFSGFKEVNEGTSIADFFTSNMASGEQIGNFMLNVNREKVDATYLLQDGDRVVFTPSKIEGA